MGTLSRFLAIVATLLFATAASAYDPPSFILSWGTLGSGPGEFHYPFGIAVAHDRVYVTDQFNNRIEVFSPTGSFLFEWGSHGSAEGQFGHPKPTYTSPTWTSTEFNGSLPLACLLPSGAAMAPHQDSSINRMALRSMHLDLYT